ncbi:hypothetical protein WJX72_001388 [[Myrmecia] bisecta]|uniref:CID domain-containing protein n=1 Tax=[Myrmecia] bisecta TaxID=41462 RepID=A0AAW1Q6I3_9CHLO
MGWDREKEFQELLDKSAKKASKGGIEQLASIAVQDEKQCYKHVCALIERQMKRSKAKLRLNLLYVLSAICRQSRSQLKSKDKYVPRIEPQLVTIATLLAEGPLEQKESVSKVLRTWKKEEVFSVSVLREVEAVLGGQTEAMSSHIASPSLALPAGSSSPMNATASIERQSTGFALSDPSSGSQPPAAAPPPPPLSAPPNKFIKLTQFSVRAAPAAVDHEAEESRFMGSRSSGRYMGSALLGIDDDFMDLSDPEDVAALFSI